MYVEKGGQRRLCVVSVCQLCGLEFSAIAYEVRRGGGKFCSRNCQRTLQARANAEAMRVDLTRSARNKQWKLSVPPEVHAAHNAVETAIANGLLARHPCEKCGATRVDAHHDDYGQPLSVRWLCRGHHLEHHRSSPARFNDGARRN